MNAARPVVLLVDDEAHILSALQRVLRREPYEVITTSSPTGALALFAQRAIAVVVSDQKMPGASGVAFLREVAARYPATKRILLTGWPEEIPQRERDAAKLDAILPKPWDETQLKATLLRCVG
ncbi:MAG TPA: response regulator [Myxococcota bacterium]|jgi:response regulator RpfG family c-di-GMP phosphodiesterase